MKKKFLTKAVTLRKKKPIETLRAKKTTVVTETPIESKMKNRTRMMRQ